MDTQLLRTFIEVSKTRHFGRASDNLYLTQSAVSFRIRQLESQLGTDLFTRQRGNVQLTAAGERLLPYAEAILQTWGRAQQDVALTHEYTEQLTLGAASVIWELDGISQWLHRIYADNPNLVLRLESIHRQTLARQLIEKRIDIALTSEPPRIEGLQTFKLREYQLQLVSSESNLSMEHVSELPLIYLDWGTRFAVEHSRIAELQRTPVLQTHSCKLALDYLLEHKAVAYLPSMVVSDYLKDGTLHEVSGSEQQGHELFMIWLEDNDKTPVIEELCRKLS